MSFSTIARCTRAVQHNFFDKLIPVPASRVGAGTIIWGMGSLRAWGIDPLRPAAANHISL
ncbi:hypothetical protein [Microcoleus sp. LEGE 07076]|uniref:hypothetical protein n=1 Tax=Microcoleus sp. LEGE 07076 TaxID=915322 RepID=UPI00187EDBDE|nr:hypothetical protein [Microcoleus sp. LEGE 07076]